MLKYLAFAGMALAFVPATSSAVAIEATFASGPGTEVLPPFSSDIWEPTVVPLLTVDFSVDKRFEFTYSAPDGFRFEIAPAPADATTYELFADIWSMGPIISPVDLPGDSVSFGGATGTLPTLVEHAFRTGVSEWRAFAKWDLLGPFSFESVTATFDVPAGYDESFVDYTADPLRLGVVAAFPFAVTPTSERFISLVPLSPVPAPASCLLVLLGLAGLLMLGRRSARRT